MHASRIDEISIGDRFWHVVVIEKLGTKVKCMCDCGNSIITTPSKLLRGLCRHCSSGCIYSHKGILLAGRRFGNLIVIEDYYDYEDNGKNNGHWCHCLCDCGNEYDCIASVLTRGSKLCCDKCSWSRGGQKHKKHGLAYSRFYYIWRNMRSRCCNIKDVGYPNYGGRGINCLWNSFEEFKDDMYESYLKHVEEYGEKDTTLDRVDVDGNYCIENCRWATNAEQSMNKRNNIFIEDKYGDILCLNNYIKKYNLSRGAISYRMYKKHMSLYDALRDIGDNNFVEGDI